MGLGSFDATATFVATIHGMRQQRRVRGDGLRLTGWDTFLALDIIYQMRLLKSSKCVPRLMVVSIVIGCDDFKCVQKRCDCPLLGVATYYSDNEYECFRHFFEPDDHLKVTNVGTCIGEAALSYACSHSRILAWQRNSTFAAMVGVAFDITIVIG
ncbi:hypothetical protein Tco_1091797 [Tanacetum coccineum]|uniref:Uncharacterized protein n=1 Tax=Tanacetum coccineum TaxID=301880 RepID=A0ABQ5I816_9ASTR